MPTYLLQESGMFTAWLIAHDNTKITKTAQELRRARKSPLYNGKRRKGKKWH